jgi:Fibronectin type III domain
MTVDSGFADSSLVLDSEDRPHIAYCANGYLKYAVLENAEVTSSPSLGEPLNLQATIGNGNVTLSWSAPSLNIGQPVSNYKVYRGTTLGSESFLAIADNATTYTDVLVDKGITYYYRVSAVSSEGEGAKSNQATTTLNPSNPPNIQAHSNSDYIIILVIVLILALTLIIVFKKAKSAKNNPFPFFLNRSKIANTLELLSLWQVFYSKHL